MWLTISSTHHMDVPASAGFAEDHELTVPILIDAGGVIVYQGAIDDDPRGSKGEGATNYVAAALDETLAGAKVSTAETQPYGCSMKYKS